MSLEYVLAELGDPSFTFLVLRASVGDGVAAAAAVVAAGSASATAAAAKLVLDPAARFRRFFFT
jgi:hypothetical protein